MVHVLILGAAGMIGRKLDGPPGGGRQPWRRRHRTVDPSRRDHPAAARVDAGRIELVATDLAAPGEAERLVEGRPGVIFHLAAVVSGEAETDLEKGYRVNLDGTRALFDAVRAAHTLGGYRPRLVFTSSIAVYGAPLPDPIPEDFHETPLTSYGTQKAIGELLLADYTRRGVLDGIDPAAHHLHPPGETEQGRVRLLFEHPAGAAGRAGGGLAGSGDGPALARVAPLSSGVLGPGGRDRWSGGRPPTDVVHARPQRHSGRADRRAAPGRRRAGGATYPPRAG